MAHASISLHLLVLLHCFFSAAAAVSAAAAKVHKLRLTQLTKWIEDGAVHVRRAQ